jgi:hypothetical protein
LFGGILGSPERESSRGKKGRVGHVKKGNWKTKRRIRESGGGGTSREEVLRGKRNSGQVGMGWD